MIGANPNGTMIAVGDDYDYQAAITDIQQEHIRLFRRYRNRDALPIISMRTLPDVHDAEVRNYEIFDRVQRFRVTGGDNDR